MNFVNRICPKCNNPNYVVSLGNFSSAFKYKCMNCNSYLLEEDFLPVQKDDNNGWISVKDRLPERKWDDYLVSTTILNGGARGVNIAWLNNEGQWSSNDKWICDGREVITHWMPLPEPPKEDAQDGE